MLGMALAWMAFGCAPDGSIADQAPPTEGVSGVDASIAFAHDGTLALTPGDIADIAVVGKPAAPYAISFLLAGESYDASLDQPNVVASDAGLGETRLRAPNRSASFVVRAKIKDGPSADLAVAVSDQGFGALDIKPIYTGNRDPREWVASVVAGTTCAQFESGLPADPPGALKAAAEPDDPLVVPVAPVGINLAILVRGGHYTWGCVNEADLVANSTTTVEVPITNVPIDFSDTALDVDMSFAPDPTEWDTLLESQHALLLNAFFNANPMAPADALLTAMAPLSCDSTAFNEAQSNNSWVSEIENHLSTYSVDIEQALADFAQAGLGSQPPQIRGTVETLADELGFATFTLTSIGSATPEVLGVPSDYQVSIEVDSDDTARVGGTLFWLPSRYIANAIGEAALAQNSQHTEMSVALADIVMCQQLALTNAPSCDVIADLCKSALAAMWQDARDASAPASQFGEIPFVASGASTFDDYAKLTGFEGNWIGYAIIGTEQVTVEGSVTAVEPGAQPPAG